MNIINRFIPSPSLRRSGIKNAGIKYIVCHDTGNDGSTAAGNVNYFIQSAHEVEASAHAFVDDQIGIWCVPEDEKAWHVRKSTMIAPNVPPTVANDCALGIELCFGSQWALSKNLLAYANYTTLIASLCKKYNLDPKKSLVQHAKLDPTRRTDPLNAFKYISKTWEQFIQDVSNLLGPEEMVTVSIPRSKLDQVLAYLKTI